MNRMQQQSNIIGQQQQQQQQHSQQPPPSQPSTDLNSSPALQQAFQSNNLQFLVDAAKSNKLNNDNLQRLQKLIRHRQLQQIQLQQQQQSQQQQQFPNLVPSQIAAAKNLQQKIETIDLQLRNPNLSPQDRDNARKAYDEAKNLQALFIQQLRNSQQSNKQNNPQKPSAPNMLHTQSQPQLGSNYDNNFSNMIGTSSQAAWPNQQSQQHQFPSLSSNISGDHQSNMLGLGLVGASDTPQQPQPRPNLSMMPQLQPENFLKALIDLMKKRGTPIEKLPEVDGKGIDLHKLYMTVMQSGGSIEVHRQSKWPLVGAIIGLPMSTQYGETTPRVSNNTAQSLANVYREYLAPFEQVWMKAVQDQVAQRRAAVMQQQQSQQQQSPQTRPLAGFPQPTPQQFTQQPPQPQQQPPLPQKPQQPQQPQKPQQPPQPQPPQAMQQQQLMASLSTMSDDQLRGLNLTPEQIMQLRRKIQQPQMSTPLVPPQSSMAGAPPMDANVLSAASTGANAPASATAPMQNSASTSEAMQPAMSNSMPIMMPPKERLSQASQLVQSIKQSIMQQRPPVNSQPNLNPAEQHQIAQTCAEIKPMLISLENILPIFLCLNDPIEPGKIEAVKKISLMVSGCVEMAEFINTLYRLLCTTNRQLCFHNDNFVSIWRI